VLLPSAIRCADEEIRSRLARGLKRMEGIHFLDLFQGIATLVASEPKIMFGRIFLMLLGFLLIYLGSKNVLEPLLMIPMGWACPRSTPAVMFLEGGKMGTLFVDPLISDPIDLMNIMQIDWLQPIYTLTFSNGLIACLVFMGIGVLLDVGYVMARPFQSMFIALFAELGTIAVFPIAVWLGLNPGQAAAVATIGGADGPMVLFTSLVLAKDLFVPITVVGYLYLGLTYGAYPYLIKWLVPEHIRGISMAADRGPKISRSQKLTFAVVACTLLCLLFPVAAPLFFSLFRRRRGARKRHRRVYQTARRGVSLRRNLLPRPDAGRALRSQYPARPDGPEAAAAGDAGPDDLCSWRPSGRLHPVLLEGGKFNPIIGIAGVSCVPTTAKIVQKVASRPTRERSSCRRRWEPTSVA
jgi:Na+-transporting methylmalonyl-CoA/oxaloacetate decarboxylase beta subunit